MAKCAHETGNGTRKCVKRMTSALIKPQALPRGRAMPPDALRLRGRCRRGVGCIKGWDAALNDTLTDTLGGMRLSTWCWVRCGSQRRTRWCWVGCGPQRRTRFYYRRRGVRVVKCVQKCRRVSGIVYRGALGTGGTRTALLLPPAPRRRRSHGRRAIESPSPRLR